MLTSRRCAQAPPTLMLGWRFYRLPQESEASAAWSCSCVWFHVFILAAVLPIHLLFLSSSFTLSPPPPSPSPPRLDPPVRGILMIKALRLAADGPATDALWRHRGVTKLSGADKKLLMNMELLHPPT